jgi:hypothetical protein
MIELTTKESKALCDWAGIDLSQCNNPLEIAGATRNLLRHAEQWGPKLVAMLAVRGLIEPGDTPEDALARWIGS